MRKLTIWTALLLTPFLSPAAQAQSLAPFINPITSGFTGFVGDAFSKTFTCTGCFGDAATTFSASGNLPGGLSLSSGGVLSGTLTTQQSGLQFTIFANVGTQPAAQRSYTFSVFTHLAWLTASPLAPATAGIPITRTVQVSAPSLWDVVENTLPSSISVLLPPNGGDTATLSGTFPTVSSPTTYSVHLVAGAIATEESIDRVFSITVNPAPRITSDLPNGEVTVPYSSLLAFSGGTAPSTFSLVASGGVLPPGLVLNSSTGAVSGIPTQAGTYPFSIALTDNAGGRGVRAFSVTILPPPSVNGSLPTGQVGVPYTATLTASGGVSPYSFSLVQGSSLPAGLSLTSAGVVSGTPNVVGTSQFVVRVTDANGAFGSATLSISINGTPLSIITGSLAAAFVGTPYSAVLTAVGGNPPYIWALDSGTLPSGLTLNSSGIIAGTPGPNTAGSYVFTARVNDAPSASATFSNSATRIFTLQVNPGTLTIVTAAIPNGTVGVPYTFTLAASGGSAPYAWTAGPLPSGLSLSPAGVLSGTPTAVSGASVAITVTDSQQQTNTKTFPLSIVAAPTLNANLGDGVVGVAYSGAVTVTGGTSPFTFSVGNGSLPAGLILNASTGAVTGTPTAEGISNFTIQAIDGLKVTVSRALTITIRPALTIATGGALPSAVRNRPYAAQLNASGGLPPYSFVLTSGALPTGLALSSSGAISGTPTAVGGFTFGVRVTDSSPISATGSFTLTVIDGPAITTASLPNGTLASPYSATLTGQGAAPLSWSVSSGALPDGLSLNAASGLISGTPTRLATFSFTIRLSDGNQPTLSVTQDYAITIGAPPLPAVAVTQVPATIGSATQPAFGVTLAQPFPLALTGVATLTFTPVAGAPVDPDVRFSNNQSTIAFTIPAGQTAAIPPTGFPLAFQTGTTAGSITLSIVLSAGGVPLTPNPAATRTIVIPPAAPVITSVKIATTATGFNVLVIGYSNTREISAASFTFTTKAGATLATSQFSVGVSSAFTTWFNSAPSANFGGQFLLTMPFSVTQGSASSLASVLVTLTNGAGTASGNGTF